MERKSMSRLDSAVAADFFTCLPDVAGVCHESTLHNLSLVSKSYHRRVRENALVAIEPYKCIKVQFTTGMSLPDLVAAILEKHTGEDAVAFLVLLYDVCDGRSRATLRKKLTSVISALKEIAEVTEDVLVALSRK